MLCFLNNQFKHKWTFEYDLSFTLKMSLYMASFPLYYCDTNVVGFACISLRSSESVQHLPHHERWASVHGRFVCGCQ